MINDFFPIDPNAVRPFVYEDERTVSLHFDIAAIQSRMRRADPTALELDYTRTMMGFLLIEASPASLLMIGLGGGSLPKYCHKHLPAADVTVVEINPHVIALRDAFFVPADGERFRVVQGDGAQFVAAPPQRYDVLMVDGFSYDGQPPALGTTAFYRACRAALTPRGVMVVNLHAEAPDCAELRDRIGCAFDGQLHVVRSEDGGNCVVFAGNSRDFWPDSSEFSRRWLALAEVHRRTLRKSAHQIARGLRWPPLTLAAG
ncbi:MAG TPA: fused MFS/spermidine synthase [Albitalea sp.]|nr:fused MFS/spermidine synthase [Albitalea sp.]